MSIDEFDHLKKALQSGKKLRIKFGIDPTMPDLHLGHSVPLRKLRQFQELEHQAVLIIGDATAMVGDPSGRSETRKMITKAEVKKNMRNYLKHASKILDIKKTEVHYNSEWLDKNMMTILELSKGKLTSDPSRHSGEGIFFTSRMFDRFAILSGNQYFSHSVEHDDWLLDADSRRQGTSVFMEIRLSTKRKSQEIFEEYSTIDHPGFYKTHVPVALAQYGDENMVSRSQAKRVLVRVEKFTEGMANSFMNPKLFPLLLPEVPNTT